MKDWFTVEKIDEMTYAISEYDHWEETHCYLVIGDKKALLVDTGLGVARISEVITGLTDLPIEVVLTHAHWDHMGSLGEFDEIAVQKEEVTWLTTQFPLPRNVVMGNLMKEPHQFPDSFKEDEYQLYQGKVDHILSDHDLFELGGRTIEVLHTPGHSPGHICLYEREQGYLYSGDLLYLGKLDAYYPTTDPEQFMNSVEKVRKLDIIRILPGHHKLIVPNDLAERVALAFEFIQKKDLLHQGQGIFQYKDFSIHI